MKRNILSITLITLLALSQSALASTDIYTLVPPEGNTAMNYTKGAYNTVGTLKVTADETFNSEMKVDVTVQHDGKFTNTSDGTTVAYSLVKGTAESYTLLNSGDVITFTASSIDAGAEVTIGVVMTGGIDSDEDISDGDYRSNIAFNAYRVKVFETPYTFGTYNGSPLTWEVLTIDRTNKRVLLITENLVGDAMYFKTTNQLSPSDVDWENSNPRTWLRDTFYPSAFTEEEKGNIVEVNLDGNDFTDTVFLLSETEVKNYVPSICRESWWLRSLVNRHNNLLPQVVVGDNISSNAGNIVATQPGLDPYYVRPALWLKYGD